MDRGRLRRRELSYTLVEHVCLVAEGCVLTQMLSDHLYSLHLQALQLLLRPWEEKKKYTLFMNSLLCVCQRNHCFEELGFMFSSKI